MRKNTMLRTSWLLIRLGLFLMLTLLWPSSLRAATIYVSSLGTGSGSGIDKDNTATLANALNTAKGNGEDDVLYLKTDAYSGTFSYTPDASDYTRSLHLSGGWNDTYTYKTLDPTITRLYGGSPGRIFDIAAGTAGMNFPVSFENITFQGGNVTGAPGAGIRAINSGGGIISKLSVSHCYFLQNVTNNTGGAIYANCAAEIMDSTFSYNSASTGGAIALVPPEAAAPFTVSLSPKIDRCSFDNNVCGNSSAGSDIYSTVSPVIRSCSFRGKDNGTNNGGAAIHHRRHSPGNYGFPPPPTCGTPSGTAEYVGKLTVINCTFSGKRSYYWGGAISIWDSNADIVNSLFVDNHAGLSTEDYGCGGGITIYDDCPNSVRTVNVWNSTFVKNRSFAGGDFCNGTNGQAIHNRIQTLRVVNSIFWDNGTNSIYNNGSLMVNYSDLEQAYAGTGNISTNPDFVDFNNNNFRLTSTSLCRDSGTEMPWGTFLYQLYPTSSDLDGRARMIDNVDMGAYEFDNQPFANAVGRGDPNLAYDPINNRYLAVYNYADGTGGGRLHGRLINPDGTPLAAEFPISEQKTYKRMNSAVAYDAQNNKFVTVWDILY